MTDASGSGRGSTMYTAWCGHKSIGFARLINFELAVQQHCSYSRSDEFFCALRLFFRELSEDKQI
ncbi:hypothetical protein KKF91_10275 [Myxococcota bacterium]|nr:hypothetical protein [Myxococcota bacterium]